jgi:hypothetical protein
MRASLHGEDKFGKFKIVPGECKVCDEFAICVHYKETPRVSDYVKQARSFVLRIKNRGGKPQLHRRVGISCGCYAKAHRQVAHISGVNPQTGERLD